MGSPTPPPTFFFALPLPLFAHQAPVLPLKLWRPAAWNGTALVLGSIAPDLEHVPVQDGVGAGRGFAHGLAGQILFCLPLTLSLVLLIGHLRLGEVLAARLPPRCAWLSGAATDVSLSGGLERAFKSALVGSLSHLALDGLTHSLLPALLPARLFHVVTSTLLQLVASGGGALITLWLLYRIAGTTHATPPTSRPGFWVLLLLALVGGALGVKLAWPALRHPDYYFDAGRLYVLGYAAFLVASGLAAGLLVAGVSLAAWDKRSR